MTVHPQFWLLAAVVAGGSVGCGGRSTLVDGSLPGTYMTEGEGGTITSALGTWTCDCTSSPVDTENPGSTAIGSSYVSAVILTTHPDGSLTMAFGEKGSPPTCGPLACTVADGVVTIEGGQACHDIENATITGGSFALTPAGGLFNAQASVPRTFAGDSFKSTVTGKCARN